MNRPDLLIDTCCLDDKKLMSWLRNYRGGKYISAVTYMEYATDALARGKGDEFSQLIEASRIKVHHFDKNAAMKAADLMAGRPGDERRCKTCGNINWNDTMIAAQASVMNCIIVTENIHDFPSDPEFRVMTANEAMSSLHGFRRVPDTHRPTLWN